MPAATYTFNQFQKDYPNDEACLDKIMELRYGKEPICPACQRKAKYHRISKRRAYACQFCGEHVYPCVGTIFEKSTTPLSKWFFAMYLFTTTRHGVAAKELERQLGVTYKCAWRIAHQIRKLMGTMNIGQIFGEVEADETYIGGKKPGKRGRGAAGKAVVMGIKGREGNVKTQVIKDAKRKTIESIIHQEVPKGSSIYTDEWWAYTHLNKQGFIHDTVNHGTKEYVNRNIHTNSIESYWSQLKRSIKGTHIHVSEKHLPKYLGEFDFRHNNRKIPDKMFSKMVNLLQY